MFKWISKLVSQYFTLDNINRIIVVLGGRRFILTLLVGAMTSVLIWFTKISDAIYRDVILGTVGLYIAGNTIQKNSQIKATTPTDPPKKE